MLQTLKNQKSNHADSNHADFIYSLFFTENKLEKTNTNPLVKCQVSHWT